MSTTNLTVVDIILQIIWLASVAHRRNKPPPRGKTVYSDYSPEALQRWYEASWIIDVYTQLGCPPYPMGLAR